MNANKTNAYFQGVSKEIYAYVLQFSGFIEGHLPFRYLGIPITCGKLAKQDCQVLVERIVTKIRGFGTKKLSNSERLVLVNSVLTTLYNYWINIFLIPKGVLNKINSICRHYLWDGSVDYIRVPPMGWGKVCSPTDERGLGIRDSLSWNIDAIGKLVWWIYSYPDRLWVKWVHHVYLKGTAWNDYNPNGDVNWGWKVICRTKTKLAHGYTNNQWIMDPKGYSISSGYKFIRPKFQKVVWHKYLWNSWCIPKHQFIGRLIALEGMQLKDKLLALGIAPDATCLLCGEADESYLHLFHNCSYSKRIVTNMVEICHVSWPNSNLIHWLGVWQGSSLQKNVLMCNVLAAFYQIWMQRNKVRVDNCLLRPECVIIQIKKEVKMKLATKSTQGLSMNDVAWLNLVSLSL
ncbi:uncharacterized protein LOC141637284 [Silene latifolia]|uniref:uncharacterized protein LOC141637284 n=1 Tax=Silene latifolia TaxID=37657 RepID=UPI003D784A82